MELRKDPETGWWIRGIGDYQNDVIRWVHRLDQCEGRGCAMHDKPTLHPLFDAPLRWTGVLDRKCKHGIWHADRDEILYYESIGKERFCEEDCDGCCQEWNHNE